jgi:hypothetical protein
VDAAVLRAGGPFVNPFGVLGLFSFVEWVWIFTLYGTIATCLVAVLREGF